MGPHEAASPVLSLDEIVLAYLASRVATAK
jgi:hypothetical protein